MVVYIAFAFSFYYWGLLAYLRAAKKRNEARRRGGATPKSRFFCFEDITNPRKQEEMYCKTMNFLYPHSQNNRCSLPQSLRARPAASRTRGDTRPIPIPLLRGDSLELLGGLTKTYLTALCRRLATQFPVTERSTNSELAVLAPPGKAERIPFYPLSRRLLRFIL
jgi:hypothetical protein